MTSGLPLARDPCAQAPGVLPRMLLAPARSRVVAWAASALVAASVPAVARAEVPFVYSRCPRTHQPLTISGSVTKGGITSQRTLTLKNADMMDALPDTARIASDFAAPCDLVLNDGAGTERILYGCISTFSPSSACAALDPAVSLDGKKIAFSVFRGKAVHPKGSVTPKDFDPQADAGPATFFDYPGWALESQDAQLHIVDVASGAVTPMPHAPGTFDSGPTWTPDGRITFTSTRKNQLRTYPICGHTPDLTFQLMSMDADGKNVFWASPHGLGSELHPIVLADGRIAYSSWQLFGTLPYRSPNAPGHCGTVANMFHLFTQRPDGTNPFALYGMHLGQPTPEEYDNTRGLHTHMAAHFLAQTTDRRVWTAEYYRLNNLGLGNLVGFPIPPDGQEGLGIPEALRQKRTPFRVEGEVRLATWSSQSDQDSSLMPAPSFSLPGYPKPLVFAGKLGHPAALPNNGLMFVWGAGTCFNKPTVAQVREYEAAADGNPGCDTGIYRYPGPVPPEHTPLKHPKDMVPLVNRPEFHEFFPKAVVPYSDMMGTLPEKLPTVADLPRSQTDLPLGTPFGVLGASSIIHRETKPAREFIYNDDEALNRQGGDTILYRDEELCGVRILAVQPNRKEEYNKASMGPLGERVAIIGEFPVHKPLENGAPPRDSLGHPDTSFAVRFPANVPYLMQGIDCKGRTLNTDQVWQHLAPGEVKTCNGCHVHSADSNKLPFAQTLAARPGFRPVPLGEGKVPLLAGGTLTDVKKVDVDGFGYTVEFDRDIMPIFERRCVNCHGASRADAGLRLDIKRSANQKAYSPMEGSAYDRLVRDSKQEYVPADRRVPTQHGVALMKPNLTKYVRMLSARASLLYWKAANQRTDGRKDSDYPSVLAAGIPAKGQYDVDFGPAHPTEITEDEVAVLGRWIDTGAGWGPEFSTDSILPTLSVAGEVVAGSVAALAIGTVDVGAGIEPASLRVCLVDGASCADVAVPVAALAGVVRVPLPAPIQGDKEVRVEVRDKAGNVASVQHTAAWLMNQPRLIPDGDGAAPTAGTTGATSGASPADACSCRQAGGLKSTSSIGAGFAVWLTSLWLARRRRAGRRAAAVAPLLALAACTEGQHAEPALEIGTVPDSGAGATESDAGGSLEVPCPGGVATWASPDGKTHVEHRDGQTFVRWEDDAKGQAGAGTRYRVYRSDTPIGESLLGATMVADGILANSAILFGYGFSPAARLDGGAPMMAWGPDAASLPPFSGVWAGTPTRGGCAYYAVVSTDDRGVVLRGVQGRTNPLPIHEGVSTPKPILVLDSKERMGPYTSNTSITGTPNLPLHVALHASNGLGGPAGDYGDYYAYFATRDMGYQEGLGGAFTVDETRGPSASLTLRHRDALMDPNGRQGFETSWFGYVTKPLWASHTDARAYPFTERRLLWSLDWVLAQYRVDRDRVTCGGGSMGAWGSTSFCFRHPEIFAAVYPDRPRTKQSSLNQWNGNPLIKRNGANPMLEDGTTPAFDHLDSVAFAERTKKDLPFYGFNCGRHDGFATWAEQIEMVRALAASHHGFAFAWNNGDHSSGSDARLEIEKWYPKTKFARNRSYPAFARSSLDGNLGNGDPADGDLVGGINLGFDWRGISDSPQEWSVELANALAVNGTATVDVTPRRTQMFRPQPGTSVVWTNASGGSGSVTVDADGLVTVPRVVIPRAGAFTRLTLRR